ncbi:hypothetical protein SAMN05216294_1803 [Flagellimonas zhangzhouensis]|uniref:Lipoprotein n=2 Tax=Flagellimonas zhangzhouensis TaxID=1073328 RepID=A0A1H2R496_9FLAO|nr:hypothetical protein SAMN05216294_1803 [Allomuricauda zhangzhouensis]SDW13529.1 hypothetical protein SAMN04487892_0454 [Allomuricauda zhangzhouensis]
MCLTKNLLMKNIVFFFALLITTCASAQKNIYENIRFDALSQDHEVLAIVPFIAHLELKEAVDQNDLKVLAEKEGYAVQNALETYFSKRKKRKKFNVDFQNITNTNAILSQNNIDYNNIDTYTTQELCKILEVDGIISGNLNLNILLSEGVPTDFSILDYFSGDANYGRIGVKVSDGDTGKLLWKFENAITKKTGKNTTELIDKMMKTASRKFPYDKDKKRDRN